MIFYNGKIYGDAGKIYEALQVKGKMIEDMGSSDEILLGKSKGETCIDLQGKLVLPGFIDSHIHLLNYGFTCQMYNMYHLTAIDQMIDEGIAFLKSEPLYGDTWLLGRGWNQDFFTEGRFPTFEDLDKISLETPIYFSRTCGHMGVMNSAAMAFLKAEGFNHEHMDWQSGQVFEEAILGLFSKLPKPSVEGIKAMVLRAQEDLFKVGITSVHSDDLASLPQSSPKIIIDAIEALKEEKLLKISIYEQCLLPTLQDLEAFERLKLKTGDGDDCFKIGPLKLLIDGSLGARTALMKDPYVGTDDLGIGLYSQDELTQLMMKAKEMGMQIACHGIGDGAMELILNSYEAIGTQKADKHGIVHCQISTEETFDAMEAMGIVGYIQPIFIDYDMHIVEERVGYERMQKSYNWKTLSDRNIPLAGGSDAPVVGFDVFENLYSAVSRKDLKGYPENGWLPDQKLSRVQALDLFTKGGAYAAFESDVKGKLEVGYYGDFVLVSEDYFTVAEDRIKELKVEMTVVKGEIVYQID